MEGLAGEPWLPHTISGQPFLIKAHFSEVGYACSITDTARIWSQSLSSAEVQALCARLNPKLEVPTARILSLLKTSILRADHDNLFSIKMRDNDTRLCMGFQTRLVTFHFQWEFECREDSQRRLNEHLTQPLMVMVRELKRQNAHLQGMLRHKDQELDDCRRRAGMASGHSAHDTFDEETFARDMAESADLPTYSDPAVMAVFDPEANRLYSMVMKRLHSLEEPAPGGGGAGGGGGSFDDRIPFMTQDDFATLDPSAPLAADGTLDLDVTAGEDAVLAGSGAGVAEAGGTVASITLSELRAAEQAAEEGLIEKRRAELKRKREPKPEQAKKKKKKKKVGLL